MSAEIVLGDVVGSGLDRKTPVFQKPFASYTATFTPSRSCVARVYANGAPVVVTIDGFAMTVPAGAFDHFGVEGLKQVTIS